MVNVTVALAMPLIALLVVYLTLHERAVNTAQDRTSGAAGVEPVDSDPPTRDAASRPSLRAWCECGHTYEWHASCARDVCGCQQFVAAGSGSARTTAA